VLVRGDGGVWGGVVRVSNLHSLPLVATSEHVRPDGSYERERVASAPAKGHLPRLPPEHYRGRAFAHWTLTIGKRGTGWLTADFHEHWQLVLLHTCARYELVCPAYVLMPDHAHVLLCGLMERSDQRLAIEFLRKHLKSSLAPHQWQHQTHDHVLHEHERDHGAFATIAHYILENPVRAGLAPNWREWRHLGCCAAGYPDLDPRQDGYWELFWRIYAELVERT
jgi:putative transposase